jgi:hypothetical protein
VNPWQPSRDTINIVFRAFSALISGTPRRDFGEYNALAALSVGIDLQPSVEHAQDQQRRMVRARRQANRQVRATNSG